MVLHFSHSMDYRTQIENFSEIMENNVYKSGFKT